jgi:hypothetical protein
MSTNEQTTEAAPASDWLDFATIVRLIAIVLGIGSATLLAHSTLGVHFNERFLLFLKLVENTVGFVVLPFELLLVDPIIRWLNESGFSFQLLPHWKNAFVLLWLFFAADARAIAPLYLLKYTTQVSLSDGIGIAFIVVFSWFLAALAALVGGGLAGTVSVDHPTVFWWPVVTYFLYRSSHQLIFATFEIGGATLLHGILWLLTAVPFVALALGWIDLSSSTGRPALFWWAVGGYFSSLAITVLILGPQNFRQPMLAFLAVGFAASSSALALGVVATPGWLDFRYSSSPGLANLAAFIIVVAAWYALRAILAPDTDDLESYFESVFNDDSMRTALDVFAVLGGAAIIVYLANLMA